MKHTIIIVATCVGLSFPAIAMEDDFGAPFTDQIPAALDDGSLSIETIPPHLIEPAAGDYFDSEVQGIEEEPQNVDEGSQEQPVEEQEIDM